MLLTLTYTSTNRLHCSAAIIKGGSPSVWLAQISQWGIDINYADYFIVPQSIESTEAAALFVVFKNAETAKQLNINHPYGLAGAGLYIPVNALLYPEVSEQDLKQVLLWKFQLYHPTIGLVGFEDSDKANPNDWIDYGRSITKSWNFAHEGVAAVPPLRLIQVQPPSAKDVLEDVKNSINQKPLTDIPVKKTRTEIEKIADTVKEILTRGTLYVLRRLRNLFNIIENSGSGVARSEKEGYLDKAEKKLEAIIANLEELRQKEIERLLKMFEDGNDEALQYAIPLNSQYLNRGNANTQDWKLTRRTNSFNLGRLGGGNRTNVWQLENNQYESLRTKYLNAARREIEKGDFKRAAYIYAHLMADYNSAANVLEQGRFYREAAALYKDHLKNLPAAAECLEHGGLVLDAIEVYKELQRDEKVGDLYSSIGQQENAKKYYHLYIDKKLHQTDYLDAARVAGEKLNDANQAKDILISGWNNFNRAEDCLKKYFDIEASENNAESCVKNIYNTYTPPEKRKFFINVLEYVNNKYPDPQLLNTSRSIAYEIISREVAEKNYTVVKQLKSFFPDDKLIATDSSRFLSRHEQQFKAPDKFVLNADINWVKAIAHRNQFIAFGFKDKTLRMARGNWYGNIEYYFWNTLVEPNINIPLIANPLFSNNIIVSVPGITLKELFINKYFSEVLKIDNPAGIANSSGNYGINNKQEIYRLAMENENLTLFYYTIAGKLRESIHCDCDKQDYPIEHLDYLHNGSLTWHLEYFYGHNSKVFFSVSAKGIAKTFLSDAGIRYMTTYPHKEKLLLVASTNLGCVAGEAQQGTFTFFTDNYFARDVVPTDMLFVSSSVFVISRNNTLHIYEYNEGHPKIKSVMETDGRILSLMKTSTTNQIAVLTDNKKITIVNIG